MGQVESSKTGIPLLSWPAQPNRATLPNAPCLGPCHPCVSCLFLLFLEELLCGEGLPPPKFAEKSSLEQGSFIRYFSKPPDLQAKEENQLAKVPFLLAQMTHNQKPVLKWFTPKDVENQRRRPQPFMASGLSLTHLHLPGF